MALVRGTPQFLMGTDGSLGYEAGSRQVSLVSAKVDPVTLASTMSTGASTFRFESAEWPTLIAHRGGSQTNSENSLSAMKFSRAYGTTHIEFDAEITSDGVFVAMHDTTVDRTTDGTGTVTALTAAAVAAMDIDIFAAIANSQYAAEAPPTLTEVFSWIKSDHQDTVLVIEPKTTAGATALLAYLIANNVSRDNVIIQAFGSVGNLSNFADARYKTMPLRSERPNAATLDAAAAAGATYYATAIYSIDLTLAADVRARGMIPVCYTILREYDAKRMIALGYEVMFCDDPAYLRDRFDGRFVRSVSLTNGRFVPGMIGTESDSSVHNTRGSFDAAGRWGFSGITSGYFGCGMYALASPKPGRAQVITATVRFENVSSHDRWVGFFVCAADDRPFVDGVAGHSGGYNVLQRRNGRVAIYEADGVNASSVLLAESASGTTLTYDTDYTLTITITETTITAASSVGTSVTVTSSKYVGRYMTVGKREAAVRVTNITVSGV